MTIVQRQKIDLLYHCTFLPGSYQKRFVRDIHSMADDEVLTNKQVYYLNMLYYNYRVQITRYIRETRIRGFPGFNKPPKISYGDNAQETNLDDPLNNDREESLKCKVAMERLAEWNKTVTR